MNSEAVCPNILLFGRGIQEDGEPTEATIARAQAVADYYWRHSSEVELIVCSGAYSASMPTPPPEGRREALSARAVLLDANVPGHIIEVEEESVCTFTNIRNVRKKGYFEGCEISPERPLGMGLGLPHYLRAREILSQAMGVPKSALGRISPKGEITLPDIIKEIAIGVPAVKWALRGAEPGNVDHTQQACERFERGAQYTRRLMMALARNKVTD